MKRTVRILLIFGFMITISSCAGFGQKALLSERTTEVGPAASKKCGDGICDGPETNLSCPEDCQPAGSQTTESAPPPGAGSEDIPPLYFFYAIHVHGSKEFLPYTDPGQGEVDPVAAANMLAAIQGIAEVLDRYGAKATWEFMGPTVRGLAEYQGGPVIFDQLLAAGHEIGVHGHQLDAIPRAVEALDDVVKLDPTTSSGFITQVPVSGSAQAKSALSLVLRMTAEQGLTVGTVNFSPGGEKSDIAEACLNQLGEGNDMYAETGNLLFPWRPDYPNEDPCRDLPGGKITLIDHIPLTGFVLPGEIAPPDVLGSQHFDQIEVYFDQAVGYLAHHQPDRTAAWGFVTHIIEYAVGSQMENPPDGSALEALDEFLAHVDDFARQGLVIYATASEIAEQVP